MKLDSDTNSRKSNTNLANTIKQLLIDIQAQDDADLAYTYKQTKALGESTDNLIFNERMNRFTKSFDIMFENLKYDQITSNGKNKEILFKKDEFIIPIEKLSSGEKQVIYRGCFLLKDINAIKSAFVFIDEPEISLHPNWQTKIMDYYKNIFSNEEGIQTSQIFVSTHSPFIIHNNMRKNDKVIVISRDTTGNIFCMDNPKYYKCNSVEAVEDAFSIKNFCSNKSVVYLEGQTDELYFNKALEVYNYNDVNFKFRWIGHINKNGSENFTGKDSLDKGANFLIGNNLPYKNIFLYDYIA